MCDRSQFSSIKRALTKSDTLKPARLPCRVTVWYLRSQTTTRLQKSSPHPLLAPPLSWHHAIQALLTSHNALSGTKQSQVQTQTKAHGRPKAPHAAVELPDFPLTPMPLGLSILNPQPRFMHNIFSWRATTPSNESAPPRRLGRPLLQGGPQVQLGRRRRSGRRSGRAGAILVLKVGLES